jgi:hypothetical protein
MNASIPLVPRPRMWLRVTVLILLIAFAWVGTTSWFSKLVFCLAMTGLLGTFPRPRISVECFEKQWFVGFVPVYLRRTPLADLVQIETALESRMGWDTGLVLTFFVGLWNVLMIWFADRLVPWFGGDYQLWLRTNTDDRVLAWQGNGESYFRRNLEILKDVSGLPVTRG